MLVRILVLDFAHARPLSAALRFALRLFSEPHAVYRQTVLQLVHQESLQAPERSEARGAGDLAHIGIPPPDLCIPTKRLRLVERG